MRLPQYDVGAGQFGAPPPSEAGNAPSYPGHAHFWERALSRRGFLGASAAVAGAAASAPLWLSGAVEAAGVGGMAPKPIPGGITFGGQLFHVFIPGPGAEVSTVFDFNGALGAAIVDGAGTATNTQTGESKRLLFDTDMRFMQGTYIGLNGHQHSATFGFV
jgi:hypothetical protein